jgi:predicted nucleic acid-binding protein
VTVFVLDNSVTMAWCFPDETSAYTEGVMNLLAAANGAAFVPVLWPYEVANILILAVRKSRIPAAKAVEFIEDLESFRIKIDDGVGYAFNKVYELAEQHRLTAYDAAYLEIAIRKSLPLASLDNELKRAAAASGVELIQI